MSITEVFDRLRFLAHPDKSLLIPTQKVTILRFVMNSKKNVSKIDTTKRKESKRLVNQLFSMINPSIMFLARYNCLGFLQQLNMLRCTTDH